MKKQIHYKSAFENMDLEDIEKWIKLYHNRLIGSAIFSKNKSITSKLVRWAEKNKYKSYNFIPSHTGSIVEYNNDIYVFDMKPLYARIQPLSSYLYNTKDDFVLIMRDFILDCNMFSKNILEHVGEFYPFLSAINSILFKNESKWRRHCSELHLRELQKQDIYLGVNPEITPDELWRIMKV